MAKQILVTLVSTVVVKQKFSVSGNILDASRSSISSNSIEAQTCLDYWTKAQHRQ